jgi:hypothetical protein
MLHRLILLYVIDVSKLACRIPKIIILQPVVDSSTYVMPWQAGTISNKKRSERISLHAPPACVGISDSTLYAANPPVVMAPHRVRPRLIDSTSHNKALTSTGLNI